MSSDGSNSSRKENVPPELMICIDMNTGDESGGSNDLHGGPGGKELLRLSLTDSQILQETTHAKGYNIAIVLQQSAKNSFSNIIIVCTF